jgi:hypothetical protein
VAFRRVIKLTIAIGEEQKGKLTIVQVLELIVFLLIEFNRKGKGEVLLLLKFILFSSSFYILTCFSFY